jgi:predicted HTH transcriptional regulator
MSRKLEQDKNKSKLEEFSTVLPQPIAIAVSQILRARSNQETIDACLKAAEVITRYVAILCMASFRGRKNSSVEHNGLIALDGNLAWGHFLEIIQKVSSVKEDHPLNRHLAAFRPGKASAKIGLGEAEKELLALLELRNELGHNLASLSDAKATIIKRDRNPLPSLLKAIDSLKSVFTFPLVLIEEQRWEKGQIIARTLWLMGDSPDPKPDELSLDSGINDIKVPYVAIGEELLSLFPIVLWDAMPKRETYGLLLLDSIRENKMRFQSMYSDRTETNGDRMSSLKSLFNGETISSEIVHLKDGNTLSSYWRGESAQRLEALKRHEGSMPWDLFDVPILEWYANRIKDKTGKEQAKAAEVIKEKLFGGRVRFPENDRKQALLLFGKTSAVRESLGRNIIDLRYVSGPGTRWDDRKELCDNVLVCLREAVDFFAQYVKIPDTSMDRLDRTDGAPDYLAMREALVNQFIHQDYNDKRASAQVEIRPDDVMFFNPGFSFVSDKDLVEGGKSQARNPLVARALRLIGFAELAGSGLRTLQYAWRDAHRKPPKFESDKDSNSFTVNLDWRLVPNLYDEFWKTRLGVTLSPEQAQMMNLCGDPSGITIEEVASGTGLKMEDTKSSINYLERQTLVQRRDERYFVADHLRDLVK